MILANSADPDEMQHYAAFHLGLHCLPKYPFGGFQYTKGYVCLFVFVALRPMSTAMVIAGQSVHLNTLFPGQA